jgi:ribosomal protein S18 acetylase RimI-like enzyme
MNYVEMVCDLSQVAELDIVVPPDLAVKPLADADVEEIYQCYVAAFSVGDAQFFYSQNETEKREFFDTLGRERALPEAASHILLQGSRLVSFAYVLPYGEGNCHISCMCVHPDFQGQGLGKLSLQIIQKRAAAQGYKTITLGTETGMRAFQLYRKYGFAIVEP